MWRRVLLVLGIGVVITGGTALAAHRGDYSSFDPRATIPLIVGLAGGTITLLATVMVLLGAIAERRATEQAEQMTAQLQEREHDLLQSNRELERFATIAAHDLQEPLRTIMTFTSLIERKHGATMEGEALDYLLRVAAAAQRMRALVEDLLVYARIGQVERQFNVIDLNDMVVAAIANVEQLVIESQAEIEVGALPTVRGNAPSLTQLFTNLITNALKYRLHNHPKVTISSVVRGDEWIISVQDNGKGIDPQHHDRIFELFRRVEPRGTTSGTGLGLAICARVVDVHGGRIWVNSTVGQGATFFFTLPVQAERKRQTLRLP